MFEERELAEERLDGVEERGGDDEGRGTAVGEYVAVMLGGEERVEEDGNDAGFDGAEKRGWVVDGVEHQECDAGFARDGVGCEEVGKTIGVFGERGVGESAGWVDKSGLFATALGEVAIDKVDGCVVATRMRHSSYSERFLIEFAFLRSIARTLK